MTDPMDDEVERWFYDLGKLAKVVEDNHARSRRADTMITVVAVIALAAFLLLAWRTQVNDARIEDNRVRAAYESCVNGTAILKRFNAQQQALSDVERNAIISGDLPQATESRQERIRIYEKGIIPLPECRRPQ